MSYVDKAGVRHLTRAEKIAQWTAERREARRKAQEAEGRIATERLARAENEAAVAFARNHRTSKVAAHEPEPRSVVSDTARKAMRSERLQEGWG